MGKTTELVPGYVLASTPALEPILYRETRPRISLGRLLCLAPLLLIVGWLYIIGTTRLQRENDCTRDDAQQAAAVLGNCIPRLPCWALGQR